MRTQTPAADDHQTMQPKKTFITPPTRMQRAYGRLRQLTYFDPIYLFITLLLGVTFVGWLSEGGGGLADAQNNWLRSFGPQLNYVRGPPPA